jgi:hypothetical protein
MLNRNPGLRDICHSITGGALVAQGEFIEQYITRHSHMVGYWMPYEAAKAIAATFCWNIRYALTPVFGIDFPGLCIPPDSDKYGDMVIDPAITKRCASQAKKYLEMEHSNSQASTATPNPPTPDTPTYPRYIKQPRPDRLHLASAYGSNNSSDDNYSLSSPEPGFRNIWTPANTPRSVPQLSSPHTLYDTRPPKPSPVSQISSLALSPKSRMLEVDEAYDGDSSEHEEEEDGRKPQMNDEKAAYLLMSLKLQGADSRINNLKRRAST